MSSADRVGRLLNLVPYLLARPGIELAEVAAELGVDLPELELARARLDEAITRFGDDRDYGAVARLVGW